MIIYEHIMLMYCRCVCPARPCIDCIAFRRTNCRAAPAVSS